MLVLRRDFLPRLLPIRYVEREASRVDELAALEPYTRGDLDVLD
jgi:hypothetical protein